MCSRRAGTEMTLLETYIERAEQFRREAAATTLANVRDRCVRSALAWEGMAAQLQVTEAYRATEAARKADPSRT